MVRRTGRRGRAGPAIRTSSGTSHARAAFLLSVTDAAKANAWIAKAADGKGTAATYGGVALTLFGTGDSTIAVGVDDTVLIGGDVATVHEIVDAKGAGGLASTADFKKALANSPKDRIGFFYVQTKKLLDAEMASMPSGANAFPAALLDQIPAWAGGGVLFDSNALVFDEIAPFATGATVPTNRTSTIAAHLPASTVATFEGHDVGKAIKDAIKVYQGIPAYKDAITSALDTLDKAGGLDSYTSWLGDTAVAVTVDGTTVGGGVVVTLATRPHPMRRAPSSRRSRTSWPWPACRAPRSPAKPTAERRSPRSTSAPSRTSRPSSRAPGWARGSTPACRPRCPTRASR